VIGLKRMFVYTRGNLTVQAFTKLQGFPQIVTCDNTELCYDWEKKHGMARKYSVLVSF
jgi:hypothetical protein